MPPDPHASRCANCGAEVTHAYCAQCGQHRRQSERLRVREIIARFGNHLLNLESAFLGTLVGLTIRPGRLCREYVQGRRKRYMNPAGHFILAGTASLLIAAGIERIFGEPANAQSATATTLPATSAAAAAVPAELAPEYATWLLLALMAPLAAAWWRLFRRAGYNFAENCVFALYVLAQFTWFELVLLTPLAYVLPPAALGGAYLVSWLAYLVFAGKGFYDEGMLPVVIKMLVSMLALVPAMLILALVLWMISPQAFA